MAITAYDPPGNMTDFDRLLDPGLARRRWSDAMSGWFDEAIASEKDVLHQQPCQYFNQLRTPPEGLTLEQAIVWNGFSGTLRNRFGRAVALERAELLVPLDERIDGPGSYYVGEQWKHLYYRPHDEYCEFRVTRRADGKITSVTFTSEPPEYWQALHGDTLGNINGEPTYPTAGDPGLVLDLYREFVSPDVQPEDLVCAEDLVDHSTGKPVVAFKKGAYNPFNRWNTTDGIMHLTDPPNSLTAEVKIGADATVLRSASGFGGPPIADPDRLIACAAYGGLNRCSDPTIGGSVNELAALGLAITLRNPVGLYMDHLDMTGWEAPDGSPIDPAWFRVLRGQPDMIERAVFEVPAEHGFCVGDVTIGGVPITLGGHLAEHMTVKFVGLATAPGKFSNKAVPPSASAYADGDNPAFMHFRTPGQPLPPGAVPVFDYPDAKSPALAEAGPAAPPLKLYPPHKVR